MCLLSVWKGWPYCPSTRSQSKTRHFRPSIQSRRKKIVKCVTVYATTYRGVNRVSWLISPRACYVVESIRSDSDETESGNRAGDATVP